MKALVESFLADGYYNLCNSNFALKKKKLMGMASGCSWRWIYIASIHLGHGCCLLVGVERWLLLGGL